MAVGDGLFSHHHPRQNARRVHLIKLLRPGVPPWYQWEWTTAPILVMYRIRSWPTGWHPYVLGSSAAASLSSNTQEQHIDTTVEPGIAGNFH